MGSRSVFHIAFLAETFLALFAGVDYARSRLAASLLKYGSERLECTSYKYILLLCIFFVCVIPTTLLAVDTGFNPKIAYYLSDDKNFSMEEASAALDAAIAKNKPVLIYVHGRGKEPNKSLRNKKIITSVLEASYGVAVLMVNWNSYGFLWDRKRPLNNVHGGTERLGALFLAMQNKQIQGRLPKNITLIAHSMGNVVLQDAIEAGAWEGVSSPLFANIVMSQADADAQGHQRWLSRLARVEKVWVTFNDGDRVLSRAGSGRAAGIEPLGLGPTKPLVERATYLNFTPRMGDRHQVFNKKAMGKNEAICDFFQRVLASDSVDLSVLGWKKSPNGSYTPPDDTQGACLKNTLADENIDDDD
jgi:hypothetical protein